LAAFDEGEPGFRSFVVWAEPRLRRAFMATYGVDRGREATAEALAAGWEHWERVRKMGNPLGYCFRVGQSRTRHHKMRVVYSIPDDTERWVEPRLPEALALLPKRQRVAVVLSCGYGLPVSEVAQLMRSRPSTVQTHVARGLAGLRRSLKVNKPVPGTRSPQSVCAPAAVEDPKGGTSDG
jgi:DNA-directed RNA polymerase specialized sigma24 family protein